MLFGILADILVLAHFSFIVFVVLGGLLLFRWRWLIWVHLPAVIWGAAIEFFGWICPLTPLEQRLRQQAGTESYEGDFVERYILPVMYPESLTVEIQTILGWIVILVNVAVYIVLWRQQLTSNG